MVNGEKHFPTHRYLMCFNEALFELQSKNAINKPCDEVGMYVSIILNSAIMVEGVIEDLLIFSVQRDRDLSKTDEAFNSEKFLQRVKDATGIGLLRKLNQRFDMTIEEFEQWEDVRNLFNFRDLIAHGNTFGYAWNIGFNEDGKYENDFEILVTRDKSLFRYLEANELISMGKDATTGETEFSIFTLDVAKHFNTKAKRFLLKVIANLPVSETKYHMEKFYQSLIAKYV